MDILYTGKVDGFCIVSSDSDFTRLAIRLREAGMQVIGIGEKKTPLPFITACDKFIYIEILRKAAPVEKKARETKRKGAAAHEHHPLNKVDSSVVNLLMQSVMDLADEDGWAPLSTLGHFILKRKPDFDPRNYGFAKLLSLIRSLDRWLVIDERETGNRNTRNIFVRIK